MGDLTAAWNTLNADPTQANLDAFLGAAAAVLATGRLLPDEMARRYQLATGAQSLPAAVVTAERPSLVPWVLGLVVAWWALR